MKSINKEEFKMNKNIKKLLFLLLVSLLFATGCKENFLETNPPNKLSPATFWKTENDAKMALVAIYDPLDSYALYGAAIYLEVCGPNAYNNYPWEGYKTVGTGELNPEGPWVIANKWKTCWSGIGRANTFLNNVGNVTMDEATKKEFIAEAKFLRALYYHNLVNYYGGVPVITESPKEEHGQLPRNTREECVTQILKDLDEAIIDLPEDAKEEGRVTKGAALSLKAKVLLYASRWKEAADAAKAVMDLGKYSLDNNYRELFLGSSAGKPEVIFALKKKSPEFTNAWDTYLAPMNSGVSGWASIVPMKNLVDDYHMKDGKPITESALFDANAPYENRDPRFKQTIFYHGGKWNGTTFDSANTYTGYAFQKYSSYDSSASDAVGYGKSVNDYLILRYADVLLMYAEAENEANGPSQAVYDAINLVRQRAGMPDVGALGKDALRDFIRHERRIEFAGEGYYYSDIRRWKIGPEVTRKVTFEARTFDPNKNYLWPIPAREFEINKNPGFKQNPGY
ncbi:MAG: RagB/SusD family nutrient uptake outer membrane protein [Ignavibacteriae bacterium]|nr:MAG: RagB/SusD family nutrient uptake outer membrane protein [Ignavibacteriota bacterium]